MKPILPLLLLSAPAILSGCSLIPPAMPPVPDLAASLAQVDSSSGSSSADWWFALEDPELSRFVSTGLAQSPTLGQALARIDEARAQLGEARAAQMLRADGKLSLQRAQSMNSEGTDTVIQNTASAGMVLGWELDVFGRVRASVEAGRHQLSARTADAEATRLVLAAQIADAVLALRVCRLGLSSSEDIAVSRERMLEIFRRQSEAGLLAQQDFAQHENLLAQARQDTEDHAQQCARERHALGALTGLDLTDREAAEEGVPTIPGVALTLPAGLLEEHPAVKTVYADALAARARVKAAQAQQWPQISLGAALSRLQISAAGLSGMVTEWSLGPSLSVPLLDGGAGAARVDAAEARYRIALGALEQCVRETVRDVQDALGGVETSRRAYAAAHAADLAAAARFRSIDARWTAGLIAEPAREDARLLSYSAEKQERIARIQLARAWIALVRATGNNWIAYPSQAS